MVKKIILGLYCFLIIVTVQAQNERTKKNIALIIHGGAGTILKENMSAEKEKAYQQKLEESLKAGYSVLENGGTSIEAVVAAIKIMEDSPLFNAGKGAVFTNAETNEMDASIMDGQTNMAGAVAGVTNVKNPILAAVAVMKNSPHVMMAGEGAAQFAAEQGLEIVDPSYFKDESRLNQLRRIKKTEKTEIDHSGEQGKIDPVIHDKKFGTVGAVALDQFGNLAAGTSTGGMTNKKYGRIGDAPIIGAGTYANNETCGVSATGHGEFFIRNVVAYDIAALMKYKGLSVQEAANEVVMEKLVEIEGEGGVIAMDKEGNIAMPFNSAGMYRGYIKEKNKPVVLIYKE